MANVQLHRTVNAETYTTSTAIDQKQSLDLVQTMLHGGLSSVTFLRHLFPATAYREQWYGMGDQIHPYEDYAAGKLAENSLTKEPKTKMQVLIHGRSKRVNRLLDWLESGPFVALKDGTLRALQIYVHAEPNNRSKVIETYNFTIKYGPRDESEQTFASIDLDFHTSTPLSVAVGNGALQHFFRSVYELCEPLPILPAKRFVTMEMFYAHDGDERYARNGWVPGSSTSLYFPESTGWTRLNRELKEVNSRYHCTNLAISHLQNDDGGLMGEPPAFPSVIRYGKPVSKYDAIGLFPNTYRRVPNSGGKSGDKRGRKASATPSTVVDGDINKETAMPSPQTHGRSNAATSPTPFANVPPSTRHQNNLSTSVQRRKSSRLTSSRFAALSQREAAVDTQSSNVQFMAEELVSMMQPESWTQGDTQSQRPTGVPSDSRLAIPSPIAFEHVPLKAAQANDGENHQRPSLSQEMFERLQSESQRLRSEAHRLARSTPNEEGGEDRILCQCGSTKEDGEMVVCTFCDTWQHLECYGYTGKDDTRLPEYHTCYQCLLGGREEETLNTLHGLAQQRRGIQLARMNGLTSQQQLASDMGLSISAAAPIYEHLKHEGYVIPTKRPGRAKSSASGKVRLVPVASGGDYDMMRKNLFDPMLHIRHLFPRFAEPTAPDSQSNLPPPASQINHMPPPATPASRLKPRNAVQTPGSGLDLRASLTPFETPSRWTDALRKRPIEGDSPRTSKRLRTLQSGMQRLRSVQTEAFLDAGSAPSSPASAR